GRVVEGKVTRADADEVEVQLRFGAITYRRDEVVRIEYEMTALERYQKALAEATEPQACMDAADAAKADGLDQREVRKAWERAIELDPDFRPARDALGHQHHDGRWMTDREVKLAKGWIEWQGELIPPGELERRK